jgi:hypothetical protein
VERISIITAVAVFTGLPGTARQQNIIEIFDSRIERGEDAME